MAEGVFQSLTTSHPLVSRVDSCGTGAYHIGDGPDSRTMSTLKDHNITSYQHSARKFHTRDFTDFDYILAMDDENLEDLMELRKREVKKKGGEEGVGQVMLFGEFGGKRRTGGRRKLEKSFGGEGRGEEVQDPYYGGRDGFETAYVQSVKFSKVFVEMLEKGELS
jgi:low molecular weight phosphotyrosine protein phosphatase